MNMAKLNKPEKWTTTRGTQTTKCCQECFSSSAIDSGMSTRNSVADVLATLKQALREIKSEDNSPNCEGSGSFAGYRQLLLQISALHKGFLALSDAFLENIEASHQQSSTWATNLEELRLEFTEKLELARTLQQDLQQTAALEAGLQAQNTVLTERVAQLEAQTAKLQAQLVECSTSTEHAIRNGVTQAANSHFEEHLQHFEQERMDPLVRGAVQKQVQQWVDEQLGDVIQKEVQQRADAVVAGAVEAQLKAADEGIVAAQQASLCAADVAAQVSADVAALASKVESLRSWCGRADAAHANHEERLRRVEAPAASGTPRGHPTALSAEEVEAGLHQVAQTLVIMEDRIRSLESGGGSTPWGTSRLPGSSPAQAAGPAELLQGEAAADLQALQRGVQEVQSRMRSLEGVVGESCEQQTQQARGLQDLAARQEQQGRVADETMHATLTDVMALARHTKELDGEVQAVQGRIEQVQEALLQCSSTFARSLNIPSPVGPFTSFPPR